jgi:hypothetical protein
MHTMTSMAPLTDSEAGPSPVLAKPAEKPADKETLQTLRRFHLAGPLPGGKDVWLDMDILPALLHPYRDTDAVRIEYPIFLPREPPEFEEGEHESGCSLILADFIGEIASGENKSRILQDNLLRLEQYVRKAVADRPGSHDARETFQEAARTMRKELVLSDEDDRMLEGDLREMVEAIPEGGVLVSLTEHTPLDLIRHAAQCHARSSQKTFRDRVREVAEKTRALLDADRLKRPEGRDPGVVRSTVGEVGSRFLNPSGLAGLMGTSQGPSTLSEERRKRLETALLHLEDETPASGERLLTLIHDGSLRKEARNDLKGWQVAAEGDPYAAAAKKFDEAAESLAEVIRAERLARLEYEGQYDPDRHGPWLEQLDWHGFSREELHLIPPIVALVSSDHLARRGLLSLSRMILSGRPVHILVIDHPAENPGAEEAGVAPRGVRFEPGYLGMSHREAWVQQTSSARPRHMMNGFAKALQGTRTALHVVVTGFNPGGGKPRLGPWFYSGSALESRAHPCFQYDPEAGNSWARRLDFSENPAPADDWPVYELSAKTEDGGEQNLSLSFTFADFALLDPAFARHFRLVPEGIPDSELYTLNTYLALPQEEAVQKIPFVWGVDGTGKLRRLAMTRRLAWAGKDRLGYWHTLQELAGVRNEYVEEAARRAREEAEAKGNQEREELQNEHERELESLRRKATEDVVTQLTAALLEVDIGALASSTLIEGLQGRTVDEVAEVLLEAISPEALREESAGEAGEQVEQAAEKLMELIDPDRLEENPE